MAGRDEHRLCVLETVDAAAEWAGAARDLGLADLTAAVTKLGVKGPQAENWLAAQEVNVLQFQSRPWGRQGRAIRWADDEFFFETAAHDPLLEQLSNRLDEAPPGVYRVHHQEATLLLCGHRAIEVLAQVSAFDFAQLESETVIFTRAAVVSCAILREESPAVPTFRLWVDASLAEYLWKTLAQIVHEL